MQIFIYSFITINCFFNLLIFEAKILQTKIITSDYSDDWEILFDGNDLSKWRGKLIEDAPKDGWKVENGTLYLDGKGGDIMTKDKYSDFELVFDFKLTKGANSGVKYFVGAIKNEKTGKNTVNGPEYQIVDDYNHEGAKTNPLISSASAYLLYAPKAKKLNPEGEWNTGKIIAKGKKVEHWLNGVKVVSYKRGSRDFLKRKDESKFKDDLKYGEIEEGHILLTDHNDRFYFRDIKIKRI